MAALPTQRSAESGAKVPCWYTENAPPVGCRSSYQRTPTLDPAATEWLTTIAAWSLKTRYASRYISRSPSESSFWLLGCGMQVLPLHAMLNGAIAISDVVATGRVDRVGVAK